MESVVAHYTTTSDLDSAVTYATAEIYNGWDGQFNLSHDPCDPGKATATATQTQTGTQSAVATATQTTTSTARSTGTAT